MTTRPLVERRKKTHERCLYIGIDFGTTYSGVAWAWSGDPDNINIVTNWPTRGLNLSHIRDDAKAPSALYYNGDEVHWGHAIKEDEEPIRWFKLLLLKDEDLDDDVKQSPFLLSARAKLRQLGITPERAVADYLTQLWQHAIDRMKRSRGALAVDGLPFKVVLTVPAIWKPYAHEKMRAAAQAAGILARRAAGETTFKLVSEPEAAALATLSEFRDRQDNEGDVFIVCDVGGGTADIISYKIKETEPLVLHESVEGQGKLCGAMFVDEAFQKLIQERMGRWDRLSQASKVKLMNDEWEFGIKRAFDGQDDRIWTVQQPPDAVGRFVHRNDDRRADAPMIRGQIQFRTSHIKQVFSKVLDDIRLLINDQIMSIQKKENQKPKGIILVGGFGSCEYLYQTLRTEHQQSGIEILQASGKGPWTAICRGAVIRAASNVVRSRISRFNYGLTANPCFITGTHAEGDRYRCQWYNIDRARDQMRWYVEKGQDIDVLKPLKFPFVLPLRSAPENNMHEISIYQCETGPSPPRLQANVTVLCDIVCRLNVNFEDLPQRLDNGGIAFRELRYEVEMVREDAGLQFFVLHDGVRIGSQDIDVQIDPAPSSGRVHRVWEDDTMTLVDRER